MEAPYPLPPAADVWYTFRLDETLRALWTFGAGDPVDIAIIARELGRDEEQAIAWMKGNGKGLWQQAERPDRWLPLKGRHHR